MVDKNKILGDMFDISHLAKLEQKNIKRIFARAFASEDDKKTLGYLQYITFHRSAGIEASNEHLRFMEGQRSLVSMILRLIDQGRQN